LYCSKFLSTERPKESQNTIANDMNELIYYFKNAQEGITNIIFNTDDMNSIVVDFINRGYKSVISMNNNTFLDIDSLKFITDEKTQIIIKKHLI